MWGADDFPRDPYSHATNQAGHAMLVGVPLALLGLLAFPPVAVPIFVALAYWVVWELIIQRGNLWADSLMDTACVMAARNAARREADRKAVAAMSDLCSSEDAQTALDNAQWTLHATLYDRMSEVAGLPRTDREVAIRPVLALLCTRGGIDPALAEEVADPMGLSAARYLGG